MEHSKKIRKLLTAALFIFALFLFMQATKVTAAINVMPSVPVITSVKLTSKNTSKITWKRSFCAKSYELYVSADGNRYKKLSTVEARSFSHKNLKPGCTYSYKVRAVNGSRKSIFSRRKEIKTLEGSAPDLMGYAASNEVTLKWNEIKNASGYEVYEKVSGWYKKIGVTPATYFKVTGLDAKTAYTFRVVPYISDAGRNVDGIAAVETVITKAPGFRLWELGNFYFRIGGGLFSFVVYLRRG